MQLAYHKSLLNVSPDEVSSRDSQTSESVVEGGIRPQPSLLNVGRTMSGPVSSVQELSIENLDSQSVATIEGSGFRVTIEQELYKRTAPEFKCKSTLFSQNTQNGSILAADCNSGQILEFFIEEQQVREPTPVYEESGIQIFKICHVCNIYHECLAIVFFEKKFSAARFTRETNSAKVKLIQRFQSEEKFSAIEGSVLPLPETTQYRRYSLFQLRSGKLICTACSFKQIYEITIKEHGDSFKLSTRALNIQRKVRTVRAHSVVENRIRAQSEGDEIEIACCEISRSQDGDLIYLAYKFCRDSIISICQIDNQYSPDDKIVLSERKHVVVDYNIREIYYCPSYNYLFLRDEAARIHLMNSESLDQCAAIQLYLPDSENAASGESSGSPRRPAAQLRALQSFASVQSSGKLPTILKFPRAVCVDDTDHSLLLVSIQLPNLSFS